MRRCGLLITMSAEEAACAAARQRRGQLITGTNARADPLYRVIAVVDSRGHSALQGGGHGLSFEMMAEDLKTVLDTLGVKKRTSSALFGRRQSGNQIRTDLAGIYR